MRVLSGPGHPRLARLRCRGCGHSWFVKKRKLVPLLFIRVSCPRCGGKKISGKLLGGLSIRY